MSDDLSPYASEQLDELLSAEIDGELAAAARDLGVTVGEVTARLRATPGANDRRAALTAARDLMAEPPEIDELVAQRLRAKATRVAADEHAARELDRRRRRRQLLLGASGIAAAAVAAVAIAGGLNGNGGGSHSASEKPASAPAPTGIASGSATKHRSLPTVALGAFTDKHALASQAVTWSTRFAAADSVAPGATKAPVAARSLTPSSTAHAALGPTRNQSAVTTTGVGTPATTTESAGKSAGAGARFDLAAPTLPACPTPTPVRTGDTLVLRATATLSGKPVIVFVFAGGGEHSVKIENTNCKLVDFQTLR
jgi:hypothetical protein